MKIIILKGKDPRHTFFEKETHETQKDESINLYGEVLHEDNTILYSNNLQKVDTTTHYLVDKGKILAENKNQTSRGKNLKESLYE